MKSRAIQLSDERGLFRKPEPGSLATMLLLYDLQGFGDPLPTGSGREYIAAAAASILRTIKEDKLMATELSGTPVRFTNTHI